MLAYLIQHRDRVVTKEELLERLWPDRFVTEATLTSRLIAARKAVGDRGREQRLIQTLHGRGYRFIGAASPAEFDRAAAP
jgi:DNA-binding winged helix-turn-helix (wHTH) protein